MLTGILAEEIARRGPISFHEFQHTALYHPEHGYYRRERDPFGARGDFYTAEQLQPVFGLLMARTVERLHERMPARFEVVELGAGREEMRSYFERWSYQAIESGRGQLPAEIHGLVFGNEFLDALPVHLVRKKGGHFHEVSVAGYEGKFQYVEGPCVKGKLAEYLAKHGQHAPDGGLVEAHLDAVQWLDRLSAAVKQGFVLFIDYGFTERERVRFPQGTLMSYWRHQADEDVLCKPGERDITSHVPFTMLIDEAKERGFLVERYESLAQLLLDAGEPDQFANVLESQNEQEAARRRGQLKTLLYGMGETFRVLLLSRGV